MMARPRRDLQRAVPAVDPEFAFRWLSRILMASDPVDPRCRLIHGAAEAIQRRGGSPERTLAELWAFIDELGLREEGERHIAHINRISTLRETS